uniref:tyrosine-protein phosphatase n=1 Tax=Eisenbergiella tayi TaxID=1432052 RepID=UPI003FED53DB
MKYLKHIAMKHVYNFRDLGGYPTVDGRGTRWGILYRSDALSNLTGEEWEMLTERGVRSVIDLRGTSEVETAPVLAPDSVAYYHYSLMQELDQMMVTEAGTTGQNGGNAGILGSMKLDYGKTLFGNMECCVKILNVIAERIPAGGIVFMCSAGKDRTGMIAAVILYLCGVGREDIIADYMVSNIYNSNGINKKLSSLPESVLKLVPDQSLLDDLIQSRPETMIQLLDEMEKRDLRSCLTEHGFNARQQEAFKELVTEA